MTYITANQRSQKFRNGYILVMKNNSQPCHSPSNRNAITAMDIGYRSKRCWNSLSFPFKPPVWTFNFRHYKGTKRSKNSPDIYISCFPEISLLMSNQDFVKTIWNWNWKFKLKEIFFDFLYKGYKCITIRFHFENPYYNETEILLFFPNIMWAFFATIYI
jgi:hypothetical protein